MNQMEKRLWPFEETSAYCLILTLAVCALLCREPNRSMEEAMEDIAAIHDFLRKKMNGA